MAQTLKDHEARIQKLELALSQIAEVAEAVSRHERILKGGDNNDPGLLERTRNIEQLAASASAWLKAIAMLFLAQFVAVLFGGISFVVKLLPALIELSK